MQVKCRETASVGQPNYSSPATHSKPSEESGKKPRRKGGAEPRNTKKPEKKKRREETKEKTEEQCRDNDWPCHCLYPCRKRTTQKSSSTEIRHLHHLLSPFIISKVKGKHRVSEQMRKIKGSNRRESISIASVFGLQQNR
jgi:hypothetical protein